MYTKVSKLHVVIKRPTAKVSMQYSNLIAAVPYIYNCLDDFCCCFTPQT